MSKNNSVKDARTDEKIGKYAKMTLDFTFKRVFGNSQNKETLIAFLNSVLGDTEIDDVELIPTEKLGATMPDRKVIFDIACKGKDGTEFIVEVQCVKQTFFRDRALYYVSYPIMEQGKSAIEKFVSNSGNDTKDGKSRRIRWDYSLKPVRFIAVLNFAMEHAPGWAPDKYHSSYRLREDVTQELMNDKLQFIFLELGRFHKTKEELETSHDKWMYALKHMHEFEERPDELNEKEFDMLFNLAKIANFAPEEFTMYRNEFITDNDYLNAIDYAKQEGEERGFEAGKAEGEAIGEAKGLETGLARGREEERINVAKKFLAVGVDIKTIAECTSLTEEEIAAL